MRTTLGVAGYKAHEVLRIDCGILHETDLQLIAFTVDLRDAHALALEAHTRGFEEVDGGVGWRAITVFHFGADFVDRGLAGGSGDLFVEAEALILFGHVALVNAQRNAEIGGPQAYSWCREDLFRCRDRATIRDGRGGTRR